MYSINILIIYFNTFIYALYVCARKFKICEFIICIDYNIAIYIYIYIYRLHYYIRIYIYICKMNILTTTTNHHTNHYTIYYYTDHHTDHYTYHPR